MHSPDRNVYENPQDTSPHVTPTPSRDHSVEIEVRSTLRPVNSSESMRGLRPVSSSESMRGLRPVSSSVNRVMGRARLRI